MMLTKRYRKQNAHLHPQEFSHVQVFVCLHVCMHDVDPLEDLDQTCNLLPRSVVFIIFSEPHLSPKVPSQTTVVRHCANRKEFKPPVFVGSCQVGGLTDEVPRTPQVKCIVLLIKALLNPRLVGR